MNERFDVVIYDLTTYTVTRIFASNLPRRGETFSAESMEENALIRTNTQCSGVAIVPHGEYRRGELFQE